MGSFIALAAIFLVGAIPVALEIRQRRRLRGLAEPRAPQVEACWSEDVKAEGPLSFGRYQCVDDELMEMDRRASRGQFPIPPSY